MTKMIRTEIKKVEHLFHSVVQCILNSRSVPFVDFDRVVGLPGHFWDKTKGFLTQNPAWMKSALPKYLRREQRGTSTFVVEEIILKQEGRASSFSLVLVDKV